MAGVTNKNLRKFGRNVARAKNQMASGKGYKSGGKVNMPKAKDMGKLGMKKGGAC